MLIPQKEEKAFPVMSEMDGNLSSLFIKVISALDFLLHSLGF